MGPTFEARFERWLQAALDEPVPDAVRAFSLNLFEAARVRGVTFGVGLTGAPGFEPEDADWAADVIWRPRDPVVMIPRAWSGDDWETCLERMEALVNTVLASTSITSQRLRGREGVGLGFADGDLSVLWPRLQ